LDRVDGVTIAAVEEEEYMELVVVGDSRFDGDDDNEWVGTVVSSNVEHRSTALL
jgi:hypothetical protein